MKIRRSPQGFTLIELLVVISIIAVLASLAVPAVTSALVKGQIIQAVNNARQIHLATMSMANDATTNNDTSIGWPGDITPAVASVSAFVKVMGTSGYISAGDAKIFAAAGVAAMSGTDISTFDAAKNCAFNFYSVKDSDESNTIYLSTRNFDASGPTITGTTPFGNKGYVVCRKAGDVGQYKTVNSGTGSYSKPQSGYTPMTP